MTYFSLSGCIVESEPESPEKITQRLASLLHDPQPDVRRTASLSLGKIADPSSISYLVESLSDPDEEVRQWSAWALGNMGDDLTEQSVVPLIRLLADPSDAVKQAAVLALSHTTLSKELIPVLLEAYSISTHSTRQALVLALSHFSIPASYELFLEASQSSDPFLRQAALAGLGELGDSRSLPVFRTRLLQDINVGVRAEAAYRLGKLGGKNEAAVLKQSRDTDPTPTVHFWSSWALGQIGENL